MSIYAYIMYYIVLYFSYVIRFQVFCSVNNVIGFLVYTIIILYTYIFIYTRARVCVSVVLNCLLFEHRFIYFLFLTFFEPRHICIHKTTRRKRTQRLPVRICASAQNSVYLSCRRRRWRRRRYRTCLTALLLKLQSTVNNIIIKWWSNDSNVGLYPLGKIDQPSD